MTLVDVDTEFVSIANAQDLAFQRFCIPPKVLRNLHSAFLIELMLGKCLRTLSVTDSNDITDSQPARRFVNDEPLIHLCRPPFEMLARNECARIRHAVTQAQAPTNIIKSALTDLQKGVQGILDAFLHGPGVIQPQQLISDVVVTAKPLLFNQAAIARIHRPHGEVFLPGSDTLKKRCVAERWYLAESFETAHRPLPVLGPPEVRGWDPLPRNPSSPPCANHTPLPTSLICGGTHKDTKSHRCHRSAGGAPARTSIMSTFLELRPAVNQRQCWQGRRASFSECQQAIRTRTGHSKGPGRSGDRKGRNRRGHGRPH
mmetsp:Transcript_16297/g.45094  ORF Transcript_16297/g.45094 Transcript_16297/m.45094 type:complete len:315 (-) Transcript_16297:82-1026(-)